MERAFAALKGLIPDIDSLEWGTNVSAEGLTKGFSHMVSQSRTNTLRLSPRSKTHSHF